MKLLPHQWAGAQWLASKKYALLADQMRVGKSVQSITACDLICAKQILIICPTIAKLNWADEFRKWSIFDRPIDIVMTGKDKPNAGVIICSYDLAKKVDLPKGDVLIIDESHYVINPSSARSKITLGKEGLVRRYDRCWCLSGTPAKNNAGEVWLLLHVFGVYKFKRQAFIRRFCTGRYEGFKFKITGNNKKNIPELKHMLRAIMLRRTLEQVMPELPVLDIGLFRFKPGKVDEELWFPDLLKFPHQRQHIRQESLDLQTTLRRTRRDKKADVLRSLDSGHYSQMRKYVGLAKIDPTLKLICNELESGTPKIVVFAWHHSVIMALRMGLEKLGYKYSVITGKTRQSKRVSQLKAFKDTPNCRVFIGNILAAGVNIDLSAANLVYLVEASWVPDENLQAIFRLRNINKKAPVVARFLCATGTVDVDIQNTLVRKSKNLMEIFNK